MRHASLAFLLAAVVTSFTLTASAGSSTTVVPQPAPLETSVEQSKININTADAVTLQRDLSEIGKAKSEAIVAYREANGNFTSVDELLEVKGIGKAILERNRDKVTVN